MAKNSVDASWITRSYEFPTPTPAVWIDAPPLAFRPRCSCGEVECSACGLCHNIKCLLYVPYAYDTATPAREYRCVRCGGLAQQFYPKERIRVLPMLASGCECEELVPVCGICEVDLLIPDPEISN